MSSAFVTEPIPGGFFYATGNPSVSIFKLAEEGEVSLLANILDDKPNRIHERDNEIGMQVLHHACANGRTECARMLLQRGSSLTEKDSMGRTPFFFTWPFPECARLLLHSGADVNTLDNYGYTALHNCCYHGNFDVAKIIIEEQNQRTDMIATNLRNGDTILHSVCRNGHIRIVILLVRAGVELNIKNNDNKVPFECFKDEALRHKCTLLSDVEIISIDVLRNNSYNIWFWLIQETEFDAHNKVTQYVYLYPELVHAKDTNGRSAIEMASKLNRLAFQALLLWFGRYRIVESRPEHISPTCYLYKALDELDLDTRNNPKQVALKLIRHRSHFRRELEARKTGFSHDYVVDIVDTYPKDIGDTAGVSTSSDSVTIDIEVAVSDGGVVEMLKHQAEQFYTLVMPLADRNMYVAMKQERFAGRDMEAVRHVFSQLARCVQHMHDIGYLHGDLKPLNIVRDGSQWKLIDLDASCVLGKDMVCSKFSSAYIPPEAVYINRTTNRAVVRNELLLSDTTDSMLKDDFLLLAHPSFDVWSLGCILYQLCAPDVRPLFQCDQDDNLTNIEPGSISDEDCLLTLGLWSDRVKERKLSKIPDLLARNLLAQMLSKDVHRRPNISRIISHPFLSGKKVVRLVDQEPEYDVFLSYRVASDSLHVQRLYDHLVNRGHKVWWDKACLKPGVPWKEGFCAGLASSRTFVCLLSRNAINHPTVDFQNFSKLSETSKCDNVFLEYRLALELRELGYIEKILPVLIGDIDVTTGLYGSYFRAGCLPVAPAIVVEAAEQDLLYYMDSLALGTCITSQPTVAATLGLITACQGVQIEGNGDTAFLNATDIISNMLIDSKRKSPRSSVEFTASPRTGTTPREPVRSLLVSKDEEIRVLREQLLEKNEKIISLQSLLNKNIDSKL